MIDYDRVMLLDNGRIAEFDRSVLRFAWWYTRTRLIDSLYSPATLLRDTSSKFYSLCKATGKEEFAMLKKLAGA